MAKKLTQAEQIAQLSTSVEGLIKSNEKLAKLLVPKKVQEIASHEDFVPSDSAYDDFLELLFNFCDQYGGSLAYREIAQALDTAKFIKQLQEHLVEEE